MDSLRVEAARRELERIVNQEAEVSRKLIAEIQEPDIMLVRDDLPYFIRAGEHEVFLDVGQGLVAKARKGKYQLSPHISLGYGDFTDYHCLNETMENLRSLGFLVPDAAFFRIVWQGNDLVVTPEVVHSQIGEFNRNGLPPNVYLTENLRVGNYEVADFTEENARNLVNGQELISAFQTQSATLKEIAARGLHVDGVKISYEYHLGETSIDAAIRKMFLLQVPTHEGKEGRLVLGDLDHIYVFTGNLFK